MSLRVERTNMEKWKDRGNSITKGRDRLLGHLIGEEQQVKLVLDKLPEKTDDGSFMITVEYPTGIQGRIRVSAFPFEMLLENIDKLQPSMLFTVTITNDGKVQFVNKKGEVINA